MGNDSIDDKKAPSGGISLYADGVKASTSARLTKKSNIEAQELAFFYKGEPPDGF